MSYPKYAIPSAIRAWRAALTLAAASVAMLTAAAGHAQGPGVDPEAERLLRRMTDYMAGLPRLSVDTHNTLEAVLASGQKIQFVMDASAIALRPNKLRAERRASSSDQVFYYDGKTLTLYNPADNLFATVPVPDTIEGAMDYARSRLDVFTPAGDFLYRNAFDLFMQATTLGFVVGKGIIDGVECDHLAFSGPEVDWQVWIESGAKPLPRRYVVTTKGLVAAPEFSVEMRNWNLSPDVAAARFSFTPPAGAKRIEFMTLEADSASGR